jgi:hypothetical protein
MGLTDALNAISANRKLHATNPQLSTNTFSARLTRLEHNKRLVPSLSKVQFFPSDFWKEIDGTTKIPIKQINALKTPFWKSMIDTFMGVQAAAVVGHGFAGGAGQALSMKKSNISRRVILVLKSRPELFDGTDLPFPDWAKEILLVENDFANPARWDCWVQAGWNEAMLTFHLDI